MTPETPTPETDAAKTIRLFGEDENGNDIYSADGSLGITVQVWLDEDGDEILTPESLELVEKTQARYMGLLTGSDMGCAITATYREPCDGGSHVDSDFARARGHGQGLCSFLPRA